MLQLKYDWNKFRRSALSVLKFSLKYLREMLKTIKEKFKI